MKLAPIADKVAKALIDRRVNVADPMAREEILDEVHWATGGELDWEPTNIVIGMVETRMRKCAQTA